MGQKINPHSNRLPIKVNWRSRWFIANKGSYKKALIDDFKIRDFVNKTLANAGLGDVEIIRSRDKLEIKLTTSKPGLVIGRQGQGINLLKEQIQKQFYPSGTPVVRLDIIEERQPDLVASMVAQNITSQIERRISYRRAAKQAVEKTMSNGAKGIKIIIAGRLNGAEIARNEKFSDGTIPLSKFNVDINYAQHNAVTSYGVIGVKVWINRGLTTEENN